MAGFKKDAEGKLELDDKGDPIPIEDDGDKKADEDAGEEKKVVSLGKYQRIEGERDEYKSKAADLEKQIASLTKSVGNADELKAKVEELTTKSESERVEFETRMAARDKEYALDTTLLAAGCRDTKAARAHVDFDAIKVEDGKLSGFDAEAFKKDKPYLFNTTEKVSSAAASSGAGAETEASVFEKAALRAH